tara:strand:+ start:1417 stop:1731 length:315 start_codon:yes stop_codon:yes gene_type:complete
VVEDDPQCGWFRLRLVPGGPFVPAVIWCVQETDEETGELAADEVLRARIGRENPTDARRVWLRLAGKPITEDDYHAMMHRLTHGAPHQRATHAPVDLIAHTPRP